MGRPGEAALLLALFVLSGLLHGTGAQYDDYDDYSYEEDDFHEPDLEYMDEYEEEAADDEEPKPFDSSGPGSPPTTFAQNHELTPDCNHDNWWIMVDWEPLPRHTWISCLLG